MSRLVLSFFMMVLVVLVPRRMSAQHSSPSPLSTPVQPGQHFPWNGYLYNDVQHFPAQWTSIVGLDGTQMLQGSDNASSHDGTFPLNLPFRFKFINEWYTPLLGTVTLHVGIGGFISFGSPVPAGAGTVPYSLESPSSLTKLMMVYWSDLQTTGQDGEGIYWRVDGSLGNRRLTIEWRVRGLYHPAGNSGAFQAKLYEQNSAIEFHYAPSTPLMRWTPTGYGQRYGAVVGLKNYGQGNPALSGCGSGPDDCGVMILTPPQSSVSAQRAITGLQQVTIGTEITPDWYADYPIPSTGQASPYFHYTLPGVTYIIKPIDEDVKQDSSFTVPDSPGNVYGTGAAPSIRAHFSNGGTLPLTNIPVRADLYKDNLRIDSSKFTIPVLDPGDTVTVVFPPTALPLVSGEYQVRTFSSYPGDRDRSNDTLVRYYYMKDSTSPRHDIMPVEIKSPSLVGTPPFSPFPTRYPINQSLVLKGGFINAGSLTENGPVPVLCRILDANGVEVYATGMPLKGPWPSSVSREALFAPWTPTMTGLYLVEMSSHLPGDEAPGNDILLSIPTRPATLPNASDPPRLIQILHNYDLEAMLPGTAFNLPVHNATINSGPIAIVATFRNNGVQDVSNAAVKVSIRDASTGSVVYNESGVIPLLTGGGAVHQHLFPPFTAAADGSHSYIVHSEITAITGESQQANNLTTWSFHTGTSSVAEQEETDAAARAALVLHPNPATGITTLVCRVQPGANVSVTLCDLHGRVLRSLTRTKCGSVESFTLNLMELPAGVYAVHLQSGAMRRSAKLLVQ